MEKVTKVKNEFGIHARPAGVIAKIANTAQNDVFICANSNEVDASSLIDILTLGAVKGTKVVIKVKNKKDVEVLNQIVELFETGFGELSI